MKIGSVLFAYKFILRRKLTQTKHIGRGGMHAVRAKIDDVV